MRLKVRIRQSLGCAVLIVALALCCSGQSNPSLIASAKGITTDDEMHEWVTYYYLHPRPDLTVSAIQLMSKKGWLSKSSSQSPLAAFLAQVFASNGDKLNAWVTELKTETEDQKIMAALALWMSHSSESKKLLEQMAVKGSASYQDYVKGLIRDDHPPDFLKDAISSPGFLDALWGSFFATGDERYVRRLISTLPLLSSKDTQNVLIGGAAQWSLASNAEQHPRVMEICKSELSKLPDDQKPVLEKVIESAHDRTK
ncbi:MAG: hypothetical protein LAO56_21505 [Acidobacteriia bacterium]|nr:hypothetical protein [Terriglobia bacterium]